MASRRVKARLGSVTVEFADRETALEQVRRWGERGTYPVQLVYGPEGCGKTTLLRQAALILEEMGYDVIYLNLLEEFYELRVGPPSLREELTRVVREILEEYGWARLLWRVAELAARLLSRGKRRIAVLVDEAFQALGAREAAAYVKMLLGLLEHPPHDYERMVAVAATSEGVSLREIGRHRWASPRPMWNMTRRGFEELYAQLPGPKPSLDEAWRLTGGNPGMLARLYEAGWSASEVIAELVTAKRLHRLVQELGSGELRLLREALDDPDVLASREAGTLLDRLVELNLVVEVPPRDPSLWLDEPPPSHDPELGVGRYVAWQTPIHREAVRRALSLYA